MKHSLTWTLFTGGLFLLLWLTLPSNESEPEQWIHHHDAGHINCHTTLIEDSTHYPSGLPVTDWSDMQKLTHPIVEKPER